MSSSIRQTERPRRNTFLFVCSDGPDGDRLRREHLAAHLRHVQDRHHDIRAAGPIGTSIEGPFAGSFFLIAAEDERGARALLALDPYVAAGVYASIDCLPVMPVAGEWLGGVTWNPDSID